MSATIKCDQCGRAADMVLDFKDGLWVGPFGFTDRLFKTVHGDVTKRQDFCSLECLDKDKAKIEKRRAAFEEKYNGWNLTRYIGGYQHGVANEKWESWNAACDWMEKEEPNTPLKRQPGESVYDYEDRLVRLFKGDDACLERTSNGAPWAMPCCKLKGHDGPCRFDCDGMTLGIESGGEK